MHPPPRARINCQATGHKVKLAWADQGYTGEQAGGDAAERGIELQVVKLPEAKKGFVLLPRRWVVERSFAWLARFRRLIRDFERMLGVLAAYGWSDLHPVTVPDALLSRLAALNASRAAEEAEGKVRWLRPALQAPEKHHQAAITMSEQAAPGLSAKGKGLKAGFRAQWNAKPS